MLLRLLAADLSPKREKIPYVRVYAVVYLEHHVADDVAWVLKFLDCLIPKKGKHTKNTKMFNALGIEFVAIENVNNK